MTDAHDPPKATAPNAPGRWRPRSAPAARGARPPDRRHRRGAEDRLRSRDPGRHLRARPDLPGRHRRRPQRRHRHDPDGARLPGRGRDAGLGRERRRRRAGRAGRQGQHGVRSALGSEPHVGRGARRARHVVSERPAAECLRLDGVLETALYVEDLERAARVLRRGCSALPRLRGMSGLRRYDVGRTERAAAVPARRDAGDREAAGRHDPAA